MRSSYAPDVQQAALELLEHHVEESGFLQRPAVETFAALACQMSGRIAEFRLIREVGRGGMGVVYLAEDAVLDRHVALKILGNHLTGSPMAVARFQREAKAAARLNHPAIVPIYRSGEDSGVHFIAMEYVEGETLDHRLRELRKSTTPAASPRVKSHRQQCKLPQRTATTEYVHECARMTSLIAQGLDFAHQAGVLHCDIKPSNILINAAGHPRITDFGIARLEASERLTKSGDVLGSVHYMSPEQLGSKELDRRTDVFSLGVVLYEMLTLAPPYYGEDVPAIAESLRNTEPRSVRFFNPTVSRDLDTICRKALERKPTDRYPTTAHLAADLQCYLRGEPIMARPPTVVRRVSRWFGRNRTRSLAVAVVFLLASLAVAGGIQLQNHYQAMAPVSIDVNPPAPGARVLLRRWDSTLQTHSAPQPFGIIPLVDQYLEPGSVRFVITTNGNNFAEFDAALIEGHETNLSGMIPEGTTVVEGMALFPGGDYTLRPFVWNTETQDQTFQLEGFLLDRQEVSNAQYKAFVDQTGYAAPEQWNRFGYDLALAQRPVVGVTLEDAEAYARWCGKRLPTAAEWEAAARSPDARLYPWGALSERSPDAGVPTYEALVGAQTKEFLAQYAEYAAHTVDVTSDPAPHSQNAVFHLLDNVMELTSTVTRHDTLHVVIIKGGSWIHHPQFRDLRRLDVSPLDTCALNVGFRCARSVEAPKDTIRE